MLNSVSSWVSVDSPAAFLPPVEAMSVTVVKVWPFLATFTRTNAFMVSYVIPNSLSASAGMTSSTEYEWVPILVLSYDNSVKVTFPSASFLTVSITLPSWSLRTKLNSPAFNLRPANFLVKSNLVTTGATT